MFPYLAFYDRESGDCWEVGLQGRPYIQMIALSILKRNRCNYDLTNLEQFYLATVL